MSDVSDESAVLVDNPSMLTEPELVDVPTSPESATAIELTEIAAGPSPYQIVSIGSEEDKYAFRYDKEKLETILAKVPADAHVAVVSVVGAFRTGKSFLLSWFLRYLAYLTKKSSDGEENSSVPWYEQFETLGKNGFSWKAGSDRNTTGIWMWSEPFIVSPNKAVLLIDTQGMFDHETTMSLTASIFGFSTLLSSLQIYNVDKRIQEDNLQQLALFSEYARMAMGDDQESKELEDSPAVEVDAQGKATSTEGVKKPFQHIEFLVRDWQHFDDDIDDDGEEGEDFEAMEKSMKSYLEKVMADREAKDLRDTREQIHSCFEEITCYGLSHPGNAVTKKKYGGEVGALDETFLHLLVRYCTRIFDAATLEPKVIHGQVLTADQLGVYVQAYADLFSSGAKFPTAGTMLEATAKANNTNAVTTAMNRYKTLMNRIAGTTCTSYVAPEELKVDHRKCSDESLKLFRSVANFGSKKGIEEARHELLDEIHSSFSFYESLNESRNPLAGMELYVVLLLAVFIVEYLTSFSASPDTLFQRVLH